MEETTAGKVQSQAIVELGKRILRQMEKHGGDREWSHRLGNLAMRWSLRNPRLKNQLFKLVDVLPALHSQRAVADHTRDYLADGVKVLPPLLKAGVELGSRIPFAATAMAHLGVNQMAHQFILAESPERAIPLLQRMREERIGFTVDLLGEAVLSEREADEYAARCLELVEELAQAAESWPEIPHLDRDAGGAIPKVNVSLKISALYSQIRPAAPDVALNRLAERLTPILQTARARGVFINFDMEHSGLKQLTLDLFCQVLSQPEFTAGIPPSEPGQDEGVGGRQFAHWNNCGIVIQAYLKSAEGDLRRLLQWAQQQNRKITVRLVKGAYWDTEVILARQRGWPVPVFEHKPATDANYETLTRLLLENHHLVNAAIATHNVRSIAHAIIVAEELGLSREDYEFQLLFGMAEPLKRSLSDMGYRVRQYCPIGKLLPGMAYLVRRLLENTSNAGFLQASVTKVRSDEELLADPATQLSTRSLRGVRKRFNNEPLTDFTIATNRTLFQDALAAVERKLGVRYSLEIEGKSVITGRWLPSVNPAHPQQLVGETACAGPEDVHHAVAAARKLLPAWARLTFRERAGKLVQVAKKLCARRFELAALEVFETGKPWEEADADVAEAIDFCRYYAEQALRLDAQPYPVPGESNLHCYRPRGVGVVIAPWNFPLAILSGMTAAGLVTGNAVIIKPAEQSSVIAAWFYRLLVEAGIPSAQFLPGVGEEIGPLLVSHPGIDWIAFTGSREVGLKIWAGAGETHPGQRELKRVICEMGGKNAMIIDDDADLDEAVPGILQSAFGYTGQKCSALSRLIVLDGIYDRLMDRLVDAARDLQIGDPRDPGTAVGPVIDSTSRDRIRQLIQDAETYASVVYQASLPAGPGYYVGPTILADLSPGSAVARDEVFGPVLAVFRVRNLAQAVELANASEYHLTGGLYSRSPAHIEFVSHNFEVGNLYINRPITGALVGRHPFGGYGMSGGGTKAGGPDYLLNFVVPRVVTENLLRHGYAGEETGGE